MVDYLKSKEGISQFYNLRNNYYYRSYAIECED